MCCYCEPILTQHSSNNTFMITAHPPLNWQFYFKTQSGSVCSLDKKRRGGGACTAAVLLGALERDTFPIPDQ